jgi:uncharacterized membrane protein YgdD (TMEM256/DUF423 family)
MARFFLAAGSLAGALAVAMAAIAAHALPPGLDAVGLQAVRSAVQIQGWHALAVLAVGLWLLHTRKPAARLAAIAGTGFLLGTLFFSGAIYAHHLAALPTNGLAPIGGITLILSWLVLAASAMFAPSAR